MRKSINAIAFLIGLFLLVSCNSESGNEQHTGSSDASVNMEEFTSMQMTGVDQISVDVDLDGAVKRLSKAVTFPTISNQDRDDFDAKAFTDYHKFLEQSYPLVHKTLKKRCWEIQDLIVYCIPGKEKTQVWNQRYSMHTKMWCLYQRIPEINGKWIHLPELFKMDTSGDVVCWMTKIRSMVFWKPQRCESRKVSNPPVPFILYLVRMRK
ncbi:hypothetical protein V8V91_00770 [Algoriphagus halophilus]|uniref:hypothetical protein n=1 Tax=Algoriphagus halophilus TaxID=226505 RepID=UPI003A5E2884